ncbi:hypothetical protein [Sphingomonas sp. LM7]|uniref:hypothetical protein n=1 Tax=Sphingomonas sp. LM7 TaxID=1938607 RepID=UPI000983BDD5|nr:hypothetical protein [Sphingomonas sp. LM7]AQR73258.1 hypothetical protein BXU08_05770 [Sphingomonas sp. LM7]
MMKALLRAGLAAAALLSPSLASASWNVATSKHFVVYAEGSESAAREAAVRLEKFQVALRYLSGATAPSSSVKVTVFLVSDLAALEATRPFGGGGIAGYYNTTLRGPFTIMSRNKIKGSRGSRGEVFVADMDPQQILFHELTHHFMYQYFPAAYPTWYSEGFAEYLGALEIGSGDTVIVGNRVESRYSSFGRNDWLPVRQLVAARNYRDVKGSTHLLYAEGWLLVHYLNHAGVRQGQLKAYLDKVNQGMAFGQAGQQAFGDLDKLDGELRSYSGKFKLNAVALPFKKLDVGSITARKANRAEEDMLVLEMKLFAGIPERETDAFADRVTGAAARHSTNPYALRLATEALRLAGRTDRAIEFADRWVAAAPTDGLAVAARAELTVDQLERAKAKGAAEWTAVRKLYAEAAKLSPDEPSILYRFYTSYLREGRTPPESAQNALYRAFELMPQEDELRGQLAADFEMRDMLDEAIATIRPAAFVSIDPVDLSDGEKKERETDKLRYKLAGTTDGETARERLNRLEAKKRKSK